MRFGYTTLFISYLLVFTAGFMIGRVYEELRDDGVIQDETLLYLPPTTWKF